MTPYMLYVPISEATTPASGECICNHWWLVHPEKGLAFRVWDENECPSPQSHENKALLENLFDVPCGARNEKGHVVAFLGIVFLAHARRRMKERK